MGGVSYIQKELSSKFYTQNGYAKECYGLKNVLLIKGQTRKFKFAPQMS